MSSRRLRAAVGAAAVGLATVLATASIAQDAGLDETIRPVVLAAVEPADAAQTRVFFGEVAARRTVDLSFLVPGRIEDMPISEGDDVAAGALIAALDADAYARAARRAELAFEQAERDLERAETLLARNVASDVDVLDATTARDLAQVELDEARDNLEDATLEAPFDALVARILIDAFTTVDAGQPVIRLHDLSELRVEIEVPERLIPEGRNPDDLLFTAVFAPDAPPTPLSFAEIRAETGAIAQTFTVSLRVEGPPPVQLLPGVTASVSVGISDAPQRPLAPETAIVIDEAGSAFVYVFEPDADDSEIGVLRRTPVEVATLDGRSVEIVSGLDAGARVVTVGAHLVTDGQPVRAFAGYAGVN